MAIKNSNKKVEEKPINKPVTKSKVDKVKDKALSFKEYTVTNKKYSIVIGALILFSIIALIATSIIYNKVAAKSQYYVDYAAAYGRAITDLRNDHRSSNFNTVYDQNTKRVDVNGVQYIQGIREDVLEKWTRDDEVFMDFIKPAFEYSNGNEYHAHREVFRDQLGYTNRFLTLVMKGISYYEPEGEDPIYYADGKYPQNATDPYIAAKNACDNTKSSLDSDWFKSYLVGPVSEYGEGGAYNYMATIQAVVIADDGTQVKSTFMAMYTMTDNEDGSPVMSNFECWPVKE